MRLLIVTQAVDIDDPVLGFFHRWIEEFAMHCESILVICLTEGRHSLPSNVSVYSLGKERVQSKFRYLWRFYRYIWLFRKKYDSVFVHMNPEYVLLGATLWRIWSKRVGFWYTHSAVNLRLRLAVQLANTVFTASKESFRLQSSKVHIMGHGIDSVSSEDRQELAGLRIITVGRISATKRIHEMVAVLDLINDRHEPFSFRIVGAPVTEQDKTYMNDLASQIQEKAYAGNVCFVGPLPHADIQRELNRASVFLHLSKTGSVDKAVLEALSQNVPVVTTSEAFAEMPVSYIKDDPASIAEALIATERARPFAGGREYVQREHSLSALIPRILALLS